MFRLQTMLTMALLSTLVLSSFVFDRTQVTAASVVPEQEHTLQVKQQTAENTSPSALAERISSDASTVQTRLLPPASPPLTAHVPITDNPPVTAWAQPAPVQPFNPTSAVEGSEIPSVVDSQRTVHAVWVQYPNMPYYAQMRYISETFSTATQLPLPVPPGAPVGTNPCYRQSIQYPNLTIGPDDRLHVVMLYREEITAEEGCEGSMPIHSQLLYLSRDPGTGQWSAPVVLANYDPTDNSYLLNNAPRVAVLADGTVWVVYSSRYFSAPIDLYAISKPTGGSWSTPVQVSPTNAGSDSALYASLVADGSNNLHLAFTFNDQLYYTMKPLASAWRKPVVVAGSGGAFSSVEKPIIVASTNQPLIHMLFLDNDNGGVSSLRYITNTVNSPTVWSTPVLTTALQHINTTNPSYDLAVDSDNNAHIAWTDDNAKVEYIQHYSRTVGSAVLDWSDMLPISNYPAFNAPPQVRLGHDRQGIIYALWNGPSSVSDRGYILRYSYFMGIKGPLRTVKLQFQVYVPSETPLGAQITISSTRGTIPMTLSSFSTSTYTATLGVPENIAGFDYNYVLSGSKKETNASGVIAPVRNTGAIYYPEPNGVLKIHGTGDIVTCWQSMTCSGQSGSTYQSFVPLALTNTAGGW